LGHRGIPLMQVQGRMSMQGVSSRFPLKTLLECFSISIRAGYPLPAAMLNFGLLASKSTARRIVRRLCGKSATNRLRSLVNPNLLLVEAPIDAAA
jgi:hypothetical protein